MPDELYAAVKDRGLPASELLQDAVQAEVLRRELLAASQKYTAELSREVGSPTAKEKARASALAKRISERQPTAKDPEDPEGLASHARNVTIERG